MAQVLIVEDDEILAECLDYQLAEHEVRTCTNALVALDLIDQAVPEVIILDVLLDGPDGFSLLHELRSYSDTAAIPAIIVSSLDLSRQDLSAYGVAAVLQKETMTPEILKAAVAEAARTAGVRGALVRRPTEATQHGK